MCSLEFEHPMHRNFTIGSDQWGKHLCGVLHGNFINFKYNFKYFFFSVALSPGVVQAQRLAVLTLEQPCLHFAQTFLSCHWLWLWSQVQWPMKWSGLFIMYMFFFLFCCVSKMSLFNLLLSNNRKTLRIFFNIPNGQVAKMRCIISFWHCRLKC